ncbi:MAG: intradiol ring-cleavage dioxygenase [Deltaproteobacteria bacterium]
MQDDDIARGRHLSRRDALSLIGNAGFAAVLGCSSRESDDPVARRAAPPCIARPQQTEGPYFTDDALNRSDIRSDPAGGAARDGEMLRLTINVYRSSNESCAPLPGAYVDLWHCDADGVYSDVIDPGFNTLGQKFLRGYQLSDERGRARFLTIYPGWYWGRTVHIHFKVRSVSAAGREYEFTSQLYFDDSITDSVHSKPPYSQKGGERIRNEMDAIFRRGGEQLLLPVARDEGVLSASFDIGLLF